MNRLFMRKMVSLLVISLGSLHMGARAEYPSRPIQIVVPFLAGGSVDLVARLVATGLAARMGQQVVVENKAGAGGVVGADAVARAAPDGYTLLLSSPGPLTTNAFLMKSLPYDVLKAFSPVSLVCSQPYVLLAAPGHRDWTVPSMIQLAKGAPDKYTYASQGIGTTAHLSGLLLNQEAGVKLTHISYNGFPPALLDVQTGRVDMLWVDTANAIPRIREKSLRPLAVASSQRLGFLPDVPTFAEKGFPGVLSSSWFALVAPAATPLAIRQRIRDNLAAVLQQPEVLARLKEFGIEAIGNQPQQLDTHIRNEFERWRAVIDSQGLRAK